MSVGGESWIWSFVAQASQFHHISIQYEKEKHTQSRAPNARLQLRSKGIICFSFSICEFSVRFSARVPLIGMFGLLRIYFPQRVQTCRYLWSFSFLGVCTALIFETMPTCRKNRKQTPICVHFEFLHPTLMRLMIHVYIDAQTRPFEYSHVYVM